MRSASAVWRSRWTLGCTLLLAAACSRSPRVAEEPSEPERQDGSNEAPHAPLPSRVRLAPEVIAAARITSAPVRRELLASTVVLPGELVADPDRTARVASPIAGRIEGVMLREGAAVAAGEPLVTIRVPDLGRLRSEHAASLARAKAAQANVARLKGLAAERLTSEQSYLDAEAEAEALAVAARATGEQLASLGLGRKAAPSTLTLRAPIAGTVVSRQAVLGQPVTAEQVLADIVDLSELWFLGRVFEKDLGRLRVNASAEVQLNAYPKERFVGVVEYIGQQVDPVGRTVTARIRLENRGELLRVGLFGTAHVATSDEPSREPSLVVPRSALTEVAGKPVVFVEQAPGDYELHELVLGDSAAGQVQVLAGLREGEQVVVAGVFTLKSAVLKSTFAEDD